MVLFTQLEGLLEIVFGCFLVAVAQFERTEAYVVIGAVGVGLDTFVEVSFGFGVVFLSYCYLAEVVIGFCLVGLGVVDSAVKNFFGVAVLACLVVIDTIDVALALGCCTEAAGN